MVVVVGMGLELPTNLCEVLQCLEKAPTRNFSLLKAPASAFTKKESVKTVCYLKVYVNIVSRYEIGMFAKIITNGGFRVNADQPAHQL